MAVETSLLRPITTAQLTNTLLMIRPDHFGFNDQTASTNTFQNRLFPGSGENVRDQALAEFMTTVDLLRGAQY